jgi:hypothetical protein
VAVTFNLNVGGVIFANVFVIAGRVMCAEALVEMNGVGVELFEGGCRARDR